MSFELSQLIASVRFGVPFAGAEADDFVIVVDGDQINFYIRTIGFVPITVYKVSKGKIADSFARSFFR